MRVAVAIEGSFLRVDGQYYSAHLTYDRFWGRYLDVFEAAVVLARVRDGTEVPAGWGRADGPGVSFEPVPHYQGPRHYWSVRHEIQNAVAQISERADAFILRVPGTLGTLLWRRLKVLRRPFAVEVVGDPWLSLAPGTVRSWSRSIFRQTFTWALKRQCRTSVAALYVTEEALQRRYPPGRQTYSIGCSDVEIPDGMVAEDLRAREAQVVTAPARAAGRGRPIRLGFVGSFNGLYKAPDVHIKAIARCRQLGVNVHLAMVGDGSEQNRMKQLAQELGVDDAVEFCGRLPAGGPIFEFLDQVELFLNASRQEGLPRALVEAMARGCPAVGTSIAGIPELLPAECLVTVGDVDGLAHAIQRIVRNPDLLIQLSRANRNRARAFTRSQLVPRRQEFYREVARRSSSDRAAGRRD